MLLPRGYYEALHGNAKEDCAICLLPFERLEQLIYLPCDPRHHFHSKCIEPWLVQDSKCPICKTRVTAETIKNCKPYAEITAFLKQKEQESGNTSTEVVPA